MLKNGDVVRLKSGGVKMTIDGIQRSPVNENVIKSIRCVWFDEENKQHELIIYSTDSIEVAND